MRDTRGVVGGGSKEAQARRGGGVARRGGMEAKMGWAGRGAGSGKEGGLNAAGVRRMQLVGVTDRTCNQQVWGAVR